MRRERKTGRSMAVILLGALTGTARRTGRRRRLSLPKRCRGRGLGHGPDAGHCSPSVSPAVVYLVRAEDEKLEPLRRIGCAGRYGSRAGQSARVAVRAAGTGDRARADGAVYQSGWRDAQCARRVAWIRVQSIDGPGPIPRLHADSAGRHETGLRHSPAHEGVCDRQPDAVVPGLLPGRAVPARRNS